MIAGRLALPLASATVVALAVAGRAACRFTPSPAAPCPPTGTLVAVHSADHSLTLCRAGGVEGRFHVALGRGGVDKRSEGDGRTPLGRYGFGTPRASTRFHRFIPVEYPTAAQRAEGRTGSAVGVHGPDARVRWLGRGSVLVDWTAGCVAVGTRDEIDAIAEWVTRHDARWITID